MEISGSVILMKVFTGTTVGETLLTVLDPMGCPASVAVERNSGTFNLQVDLTTSQIVMLSTCHKMESGLITTPISRLCESIRIGEYGAGEQKRLAAESLPFTERAFFITEAIESTGPVPGCCD